jgi:hypothetical protein
MPNKCIGCHSQELSAEGVYAFICIPYRSVPNAKGEWHGTSASIQSVCLRLKLVTRQSSLHVVAPCLDVCTAVTRC